MTKEFRIRHPAAPPGTPIGVNEAAKKYGVANQTISNWVVAGEVSVLQKAERQGQKVLLDEASVQRRLKFYRPHRDSMSRRRAAPSSPPPATPLQPTPRLGSPRPGASAPSAARSSGAERSSSLARMDLVTQEWVDRYIAYRHAEEKANGGLRKETLKSYQWAFQPFLKAFSILPMDRQRVLAYFHGLPLSPGSKMLSHRVLSAFYHWLEREHDFVVPMLTHPGIGKDRREKVALTQGEIRRVYKQTRDADEAAIVLILAQSGCRRGELCSLRRAEVYPGKGGGWAKVDGKPTRANSTGIRAIYLPDPAYTALRMAVLQHGVIHWKGAPLTEVRLSDLMRWLFKKAGVWQRGLNNHALRHAYSAEFMRNGGRELWLDEALGHKNSSSMRSLYFNPPTEEAMESIIPFAPRRFLQDELPLEFSEPQSPVKVLPTAEELMRRPVPVGAA